MGSALESVYRFCPVWMQNIGVSAYGLMARNFLVHLS